MEKIRSRDSELGTPRPNETFWIPRIKFEPNIRTSKWDARNLIGNFSPNFKGKTGQIMNIYNAIYFV